jgi:Protein of unknown function (DUF1552)
MRNSWTISRRTMLRGLGVTMALPWLEAMATAEDLAVAPVQYKPTRQPVRTLMMNMPCGTYHNEWEPKTPGPLGELPPMLAPLQAYAADMLVINNLWNKAATADKIGHYANEPNFFTGTVVKKTSGADLNVGGISMDQIIARCTGTVTRFPSLHYNMQKPAGGVDTGWARVYNSHLSWSTPTTPVPNEIDPKRAFMRLFRTPGQPQDEMQEVALALSNDDKRSVLDYVESDAATLRRKVGLTDQRKLDEYLTAVRDVEKQIERETKELSKERPIDPAAVREVGQLGGQMAAFDGRDHTKSLRAMLDVIVLGFWTDSTRVATFMFGNERNDINYSFIEGVKTTHHEASHHKESAEKLAQYRRICLWHAEQVAYVVGRLKAIKEANGNTLLDNSLVFWGGALSDGNTHARPNLPIMLAGRGGGVIKPGRFINLPSNTPLCNLYLTMFHCMGVMKDSFADSTGVIRQLAG